MNATVTALAAATANGFLPLSIEVSKTIDNSKLGKPNVREVVGEVKLFVPGMAEIQKVIAGAEIDQAAIDQAIKDKEYDGLPIFKTEQQNWVFGAIVAAVKAAVRNKLQPGSIELKDGATIPADWESLVATGERTGSHVLQVLREFKADFAKHVNTLGKSAGTTNTIITLASNKQALAMQPAPMREKMAGYIEAFALTLNEADTEKYGKILVNLDEICKAGVAAGDDF